MKTCDRCGRVFRNLFALGPHRRICNVVLQPVDVVTHSDGGSADDVVRQPADVVLQPVFSSLRDLARRQTHEWGIKHVLSSYVAGRDIAHARDYGHMQDHWRRYVRDAHSTCSPEFWCLQEALLNQTAVCKDSVMHAVKHLVKPQCRQPAWPESTRALKKLIGRKAGLFWDNVLHTHDINLSAYELPGITKIKFEFVDPVYVWLERANALHDANIELQWNACSMLHPETGKELFGAGVQYGYIFREASMKSPAGATVALFNLSWDGGSTGFGSRSAVPICVQVMNTNSASAVGIGLVGYLPYVEVSEACKDQANCVKARQYVLQTCIGHVLKCINNWANHGFCGKIGSTKMHFFPCLGMLTLDTPERVKYFGLRSVRACGICRLRKGRSVMRKATRHDPEDVKRLYETACSDRSITRNT